ncbi:MAG: ABC transporter ATP-binding protein [Acidobacteria bacterium]|nr:ABC transporter ATP-binding protein [Acidobacteriota bacterium]
MENVIELQGVSKSYALGKTIVPALDDVHVGFEAGEFTAIAGPSGSGKTTLLNIIGCLDKPDRGRVVVGSEDVTERTLPGLAELRAKQLGFIFQSFNLIEVLTAYENVEYPLLLRGISPVERRRRTEELLRRVGLYEKRKHRPAELSGGQRQRVAVARALVGRPSAVLADEPTANLDSRTSEEVLGLMQELNAERGTTFIFSTHDARIIARARRVLHLVDGHLNGKGD